MTRLVVERLRVAGRRGRQLVSPFDLTLEAGRIACLIGESGAGKSLVCAAIAGTLSPELEAAGRIWIGGRAVSSLSALDRSRLWSRSLFLLPQEPWSALAPRRPAIAQVADMPRLHGRPAGLTHMLMERMGLSPKEDGDKRPAALSGGMAQRVAMAITLGAPAGLVLVDEPTKGLDAFRLSQVEAELRILAEDGRALLVVTHDMDLARRIADEVVIMRDGVVVERGHPSDVLVSPRQAFTQALLDAQPERWPVSGAIGGDSVLRADGLALRPARNAPVIASGLSLSIASGGITGLAGPSGSGKTTLGDTLLGLVEPASGRIQRSAQLRRQKLFQHPGAAFAPWRTIGATMSDGLQDQPAGVRLVERCRPLMRRLGVAEDLLGRLPKDVSGGELQRLSLIRALLARAGFIFADEPTSQLDVITQQQIAGLLREVAADGTAILLSSHNRPMLTKLAGSVIELGPELGGPKRS